MFDWISDLISGIGDAISGAFTALWDTISSSIWDLFLRWIYEAIYGAIADFFTFMSNMGVGMFDLAWVQGAIKLFSLFGWALFAAGLVVAMFDTAIEYQSMGRLNIKRQIMPVLYGFLAVSCFTTVPVELYKFCITLQNTFSHDLTTIFGGAGLGVSGIVGAASSALQILNGMPSVFNLLFMIALGYCVIKIFFANIKRGGILLTQIAVGSLYMFSIPKGYTDGFIQWCKQVIALCLTACCYLDSHANKDVLSNEIVEQLQAVIQNSENRIAHCIFKLAGECGVATYLAAAQVLEMNDLEIQACRNRAFDRVRKQQGFIRLEDATEEERLLYEGR